MTARLPVLAAVLFLAAAGGIAAATGAAAADPQAVDGCTTIDEPGTYVLSGDIRTSRERCIDVTADDVVLDGDGHSISGQGAPDTAGVFVVGENVTVRNLEFEAWDFGVIATGRGSRVSNVAGRSLGSSVAVAAGSSGMTLRDVSGRDVGQAAAFVDNATEVTVANVSGTEVGDAVVLTKSSGGVTVSNVDGSGADRAGVTVEHSAQVSVSDVSIEDSFLGVSVVTTNGAELRDVRTNGTTAGIQLAYDRNVTLAGASVSNARQDGVVATNLSNSLLRDVSVSNAGDDGVEVYGGRGVTVRNVTATPADIGLAIVRSSSVHASELTVRKATTGVLVRNSARTTLDGVFASDDTVTGVTLNRSRETSVRDLRAAGIETVLDVSDSTDVAVTGGRFSNVTRVVRSVGGRNVSLADVTVANRFLTVRGDSFAISTVEDPPDGGDRLVVPPALDVTAVDDAGVHLAVDLNTAAEYDASSVGLYRYADGWSRLDDDVRSGGPTVSADLGEPAVVAVLTTGSMPSYNTPTATPTRTATEPGSQHRETTVDGVGFTPASMLVALVVALTVARYRRRLS